MPLPSLISLVLLLPASTPAVADGQLVKDSSCDCYLTNSSNEAYYANHRFYDFRKLSKYQGVPDLITSPSDTANAWATSPYFLSDDWNSVWISVNWTNDAKLASGDASVYMVNSPNNVYIEQNTDTNPASDTYLTLRTARQEDFQSAAEIDSTSYSYQFVSMRMLMRTSGGPGGVTAMFTYRDAAELANVQEADLEIRTQDPKNTVQYTNQPSYTDSGDTIAEATQNITMPYGLDWTAWAVHRLDWTPTRSTWYIDGNQVADITFQRPRDPSQIMMNSWSDGGSWSGNMSVGDQVLMNVQWLEMVFNSTEEIGAWTDSPSPGSSSRSISRRADGGGCKSVCSIDNTTELGVARQLWRSGAGRLSDRSGLLAGLVQLIPGFVVACLLSTSFPMFI